MINKTKSNLSIILFFSFIILSGEVFVSTSMPLEILASAKSLLNGSLYISEYSKFLGYDQALINGKYISTHPIGNTLITLPAIVFIGLPLEFVINLQNIYTLHPKDIFSLVAQISYLSTSLILFFFVIISLKKLFIELKITNLSEILFLFATSCTSTIYLSFSLRESFLSSLTLLLILSIFLYMLTNKNKYIYISSITLFLLILIREYYLVFFFIIPFLFIFRNYQFILPISLLLSYLSACLVLLSYNYIIQSDFSLIFDMSKYFDPNGPDRDPPMRSGQNRFANLELAFIVSKIKNSFFHPKIGIFSFYLMEHILYVIASIFLIKNRNKEHLYIFAIISLIYFGSFLFFHILYNYNPIDKHLVGHRHMVPQLSLLILLIFFCQNYLKENLIIRYISFLSVIFISLKNLLLIFTSIRYDSDFFLRNESLANIDTHLKFILVTLEKFGCNIINQPRIQICYTDSVVNNFGLFSFLFSILFLYLCFLIIKKSHLIFIKNKILA